MIYNPRSISFSIRFDKRIAQCKAEKNKDEAFFTGTAAEVVPIRELDAREIGCGRRGPITEQLQTLYFDAVRGRRAHNAAWLTPVA